MKWFGGNIPEAIQTSKKKKVVFIVYVYGQDELSKKMTDVWEDPNITGTCDAANCVAIKIAANSDECGFFSQIYPVVVVPSTYFIGVNGVPVEVTAGSLSAEDFHRTVQNVIRIHNEQMQAPAPQTPSQQDRGDNPQASTSGQSAAPVTEAKKPSLDEKKERAQQLIEQKRLEKQKKEEEDNKNKEFERRKLGQDMQKLREFQKDRELKESVDQMKKEREEDRKQREKIKEQIARDRAERAARYKKEKEEQEQVKEEAKKAKLLAQQQSAAATEAKKSETARIQVRLPDGSSITNVFPSSDNLQSVHDFASQRMGTNITLQTVYPKRVFTPEDLSETLLSLQLAPSAVLLALPAKKSTSAPAGGSSGEGGVLSMLFAPLMMLWNFIYSLLFGGNKNSSTSSSQSSSTSQAESSRTQPDSPSDARGGVRPKSAYQRRPLRGNDGNMRRLADMRDDDDENATWNGNSTQQL